MIFYIFAFSTPVFPKINFYFEGKRQHDFVAFFPNHRHADTTDMAIRRHGAYLSK